MKKLKSGYLLKDILGRFSKKLKSTLTPDISLYMYFGHDLTISNMLNSLGLFEVAKIHSIFIVLKFIFLNIFCSNRFYHRMDHVFYLSYTNLMELRTFKFFTKKLPKQKSSR